MDDKKKIINLILQCCVANNIYTDGDLVFSLAFMSLEDLKDMANELNIEIH